VTPSAGVPLGDIFGGVGGGNAGNELATCSTNADCDCPLACVQDQTLAQAGIQPSQFCELACSTNLDCDRFDTTCVGGFCTPNSCSGSGFQIGDPCNAVGCGDGTCTFVIFGSSGYASQFCLASGQATSTCNASQVTPTPGYGLCTQGAVCQTGSGGAAASCDTYCEYPGTPCAAAGQACFPYTQTSAQGAGLCSACLTSGTSCEPQFSYASQECCSGTCQAGGSCL
jgi:hypothetical protein